MSALFTTTNWTLIVEAGDSRAEDSRAALESLCVRYWEPLYAFVRNSGKSHEDAEDLTQAFFAHLLATNLPGRANPERGRFRTFLLASLRNFMNVTHRNASTQKRGGEDAVHLPLDQVADIPLRDGAAELPEAAYDRKWAHAVIRIALDQIEEEQAAVGNAGRFSLLRPLLLDPAKGAAIREELIASFGMSEVGIRTMLSRLRARFRDIVRKEVSRLVVDPAEVDEEIAHLLRALS